MDESNRPMTHGKQVANPQPGGNSVPKNKKQPMTRRKVIIKLLIGLVILAGLVIGVHYLYKQSNPSAVNSKGYQAVFLTNGQVYFGKMQQGHGDYVTVTDIYYLQVQQAQPTGTAVKDGETNPQSAASADTQLVKLGQELHAPEDRMNISKDQILFWENIKDDGKVAKAISDYKAKK
jgi:hypothetical protein